MHKKIVFLDIDGVLNSDRTYDTLPYADQFKLLKIDPKAVAYLNRIARYAAVVVTSSWRWEYTPHDLRIVLLRHGLDETIPFIGSTGRQVSVDDDGLDTSNRGQEILDWLAAHPEVTNYVALDDGGDLTQLGYHFIRTTTERGLEEHHVVAALYALDLSVV